MAKFITLRFLQGLLVLLGIYAVTFFLVAATPGSPFSSERAIRPEILAQIEAFYGYDKPVTERFLSSLSNILRGDFGPSAVYANRTVTEIIAESFPVSFKLGSISLGIALLLGVPAGIIAAVKKNTWLDYVPMSTAMAGICLPSETRRLTRWPRLSTTWVGTAFIAYTSLRLTTIDLYPRCFRGV